ncbi:MAG: hypothetical protein Kow00120_23510 [Anaerolineae bacterium]
MLSAVLALAMLAGGGLGPAAAQGSGDPPIAMTGCDPTQLVAGQGGVVTIFGSNFTAATTAQLVGVGPLSTVVSDGSTLHATIPAGVAPGVYGIEVDDPVRGTAALANVLTVLQPPTDTPTPTPTPTATPAPVSVTHSEPTMITAGQTGALSVFGANFTASTTVRLVGFGLLETTLVNSTALTAALPASIPVGQYQVEVIDPVGGAATSPNALRVIAPPPTPAPPTPTPEPPPTFAPPTPIPGQPSLLVRSFTANPPAIEPGDTVRLTFEVVNLGTRVAQGISAALDSGSQFVPATGVASVTLPDLPIGGFYTASLTVVAGADIPAGPVNVPIVFAYRDFEGNTYTSKADLSVTVREASRSSQVILGAYAIDPDPAAPGEPINVRVTVENLGNETARQVTLRVAGGGGVLLAGPQGDTFSVGDLAAGASVALDLPLVVSAEAKAGPQAQPVTLTYVQDGDATQVDDSMTVNVVSAGAPEALLLLASYETGKEALQPGDRFTLDVTLQNVGNAEAANLLVTFGTVESTTGSGTGGDTQTNTTPSSTFAPLGSGGRHYVGAIEPEGGTASVTQEFIVNGSVKSGIYSLPITLNYQKPDGTAVKESLSASLIVIAPPRLQVSLQSPVPESAPVGEPFPVALEVLNVGDTSVNLTGARVTVENGEVLEGAEIALSPLKATEDVSVSALVMPLGEGPVEVTVTLLYTDDLNREQAIVNTYSSAAFMVPTPEAIPTPFEPVPGDEVETTGDNLIERLLLGLLGLGS